MPSCSPTDIRALVTVFVITVGDDENYRDCIQHLRGQGVTFAWEVIANVAPMSAAFQEMINRCRTPYYIQLDEDMLLFPNAVEILFTELHKAPPDVAMLCAALWDCDIGAPLYGVKVYRHEVLKYFPYEDSLSCELTQLNALEQAGYRIGILRPKEGGALSGKACCLGEHGKHYSPRTIFRRWQRLFQKHRRYGNLAWIECWPPRLLERYANRPTPLNLFAFLGAVAGISGELPMDRELDFRDPCEDYERLWDVFGPGEASCRIPRQHVSALGRPAEAMLSAGCRSGPTG